ncbi:unnamed protein product [Cochlearia groenlandica]
MKSTEQEHRYSDSTSLVSEPIDITNWFSSYVYESFPLSSSLKESQISDINLNESLPSEPPCIGDWFSSYVYDSVLMNTSDDGLGLSVPRDSECVKEIESEEEEETMNVDGNVVCPRLFEQELVSSAKLRALELILKVLVLSEPPPDVRNWFSSYEYQSPQLSDTHELGFSCSEKDQLIVDESDTEEETSAGIFRKTKRKRETISNDYKEHIASGAHTAKEVPSDNAYSGQEMETKSLVGLLNASMKEVKQESNFKHEPLSCEQNCSLEVSQYNQEPQFPSKSVASLHDLTPIHPHETTAMSSFRQKSPRKRDRKASLEENLEYIDQESDDKENVQGKSTETGFVTTKKARPSEVKDRYSVTKPYTPVLVECWRSKEVKNIAEEEHREERKKKKKKKRKVLVEMSNHQLSGADETAGKWRCPQKNKGKLVPPLKQLRLDTWVHKV